MMTANEVTRAQQKKWIYTKHQGQAMAESQIIYSNPNPEAVQPHIVITKKKKKRKRRAGLVLPSLQH